MVRIVYELVGAAQTGTHQLLRGELGPADAGRVHARLPAGALELHGHLPVLARAMHRPLHRAS